MKKNPFIDRRPALKYIIERGYASYSSLKMYRDGETPKKISAEFFTFGTELHARFLERKVLEKLAKASEVLLKLMIGSLVASKLVQMLMNGVKVEQEFRKKLFGIVVYGRIDILAKKYAADLKTTSLDNFKAFVASMDFLQAAIYMAVTGCKDFYYIGISKKAPYRVMVFNVRDFPERLKKAQDELKMLLKMLKKDLEDYKKKNK